MKVHLLEQSINRFITSQWSGDLTSWYYPHAMVHHFHEHWSAPQPDGLEAMYDQCLWSPYSQRWWKRDHYRPKEIMKALINADPELAAIAWKDLSNDSGGLDGRLSRFEYYCNELLQIHRRIPPGSLESYHYQDAPVISLYLAGLFPEKYALYPGLNVFQKFCKAIGSPDIPVVDDLVRYMKVAAIVYTFLQRNPRFEELISMRAAQTQKITVIPFLLSYEVIYVEGNPGNIAEYGF